MHTRHNHNAGRPNTPDAYILPALMFLATVTLAALKTGGILNIPWWVVFLPVIGYAALIIVAFLLIVAVLLAAERR